MTSARKTHRCENPPFGLDRCRERRCVNSPFATREDGIEMVDQKINKCAHVPCLCNVPTGEKYCGETCRDASSDDVEIACQCGHAACPLTFRQATPQNTVDFAG